MNDSGIVLKLKAPKANIRAIFTCWSIRKMTIYNNFEFMHLFLLISYRAFSHHYYNIA